MTAPTDVVTMQLVDVLRELHEGGRVLMDRTHGNRHLCPRDRIDLMKIPVTSLAYTFELCRCGKPAYEHLVEQLWHRGCVKGGGRV